ncbi:hypothetical protein DER44DRAFT_883463 [Fusarium oxysporum]|nr:hypothetical protein DER44DRAFT_883463 [Fusarium oxysporum]
MAYVLTLLLVIGGTEQTPRTIRGDSTLPRGQKPSCSALICNLRGPSQSGNTLCCKLKMEQAYGVTQNIYCEHLSSALRRPMGQYSAEHTGLSSKSWVERHDQNCSLASTHGFSASNSHSVMGSIITVRVFSIVPPHINSLGPWQPGLVLMNTRDCWQWTSFNQNGESTVVLAKIRRWTNIELFLATFLCQLRVQFNFVSVSDAFEFGGN